MSRTAVVASAIVIAHSLDLLTFWIALALYQVPIDRERNSLMLGAYQAGGFLMVAALEISLVALMLALLARVKSKPVLPVALLVVIGGIIGTTANLLVIAEFNR